MDKTETLDGELTVTVLLEDPRLPYPYQKEGAFSDIDRRSVRCLNEGLRDLPGYRFEILDRHEGLAAELDARRPGFVFNLCETGYRNIGSLEGHIPALLEILEIPYSGAGPDSFALCRDKSLVRAAADALGVPVPIEVYLGADGAEPADLERVPYPAIFKPNLEDGSCGITPESVVGDAQAARDRLGQLRRELPGCPLLLQEFLPGAEYSVGLIGNPATGFQALPINEVDFDRLDPELPRMLAHASKTDPDSPYWSQTGYRAAALEPSVTDRLVRHSQRLFERLACRDYVRIDYRADGNGAIKLLEVNPNPAWVWKGSLHSMAIEGGYRYSEFLGLLLEAALARTGHAKAPPRFWRPGPPPRA
jgi:D-alanine-D-alanine ligase